LGGCSPPLRGQVINESLGQLPKKLAASSVAGSYGRRFREFFP
jgi:hypothetical protein